MVYLSATKLWKAHIIDVPIKKNTIKSIIKYYPNDAGIFYLIVGRNAKYVSIRTPILLNLDPNPGYWKNMNKFKPPNMNKGINMVKNYVKGLGRI